MITELTPNLITLLKSDRVDDNNLALVLMGYNETRTDLDKLEDLLDAYGLEIFYLTGQNGSNHFPLEKMIIVNRETVKITTIDHEKGNTEST